MKFYTARNDLVFKAVMTTKQNVLKKIIESIIEEEIEDLTILNSELTAINVKSKKRIVDIYIEIRNLYVNLEMNSSPTKYTNIRNISYMFNIFNEGINKGETYKSLLEKEFIGINLTYKDGKNIKEEYKLQNKEEEKFIENFKVIEINMEKLNKEWYNLSEKEQEKYKYLYMLDLQKNTLKNFIGDEDKVMKEYEEAILKINQNGKFRTLLTEEEDAENCYKSDLELAVKQSATDIAKKMLMKNKDVEEIQEFTGLSIDEIKELC